MILYIPDIDSSVKQRVDKDPLLSYRISTILDFCSAMQKPFSIINSNLSILGLSSWANGDLFRKSFPSPMSCKVLFTYSSKIARLQAFTLRSWVHLGLVFV